MKKNLFSWMTIMMVAIVSVGFVSCSGGEEDKSVVAPDQSGTTTSIPDPEGTILINMPAVSGEHYFDVGFGYSALQIDENSNFTGYHYYNVKISSVGYVRGLSEIKSIPNSGWANKIAVVPGTGYVIRGSYYSESPTYARLYVVSSTSSGYAIKYQSPFVP